jgi:hypothetical protein
VPALPPPFVLIETVTPVPAPTSTFTATPLPIPEEVYSGTLLEWSLRLAQGLREAGKYVGLYQYEGEGRSFIAEPWFGFMRRVLRFFDANVKNG